MASSSCQQNFTGKQVGGTCWLNAIVNGFLLSPKGKLFLRKMVALKANNKKHAPFWSFIHNRLRLPKNTGSYKTRYLQTYGAITCTSRFNVESGMKLGEIVEYIKTIFGDYIFKNYIRVREVDLVNKDTLTNSNNDFGLSHAILVTRNKHAISGYMCGSTQWTYDSGTGKHEQAIWKTPSDKFPIVYGVYLKPFNEAINNSGNIKRLSPGQFKFLKSRIHYSPNKPRNIMSVQTPGTKLYKEYEAWKKLSPSTKKLFKISENNIWSKRFAMMDPNNKNNITKKVIETHKAKTAAKQEQFKILTN